MTIHVERSGVACCGNCGSHLEIVCSGGCAEPDIVFRENYIATMRKPQKDEKRKCDRAKHVRSVKPPPPHCTYYNCTDPIAPAGKMGRKPTRCIRHLLQFRKVAA